MSMRRLRSEQPTSAILKKDKKNFFDEFRLNVDGKEVPLDDDQKKKLDSLDIFNIDDPSFFMEANSILRDLGFEDGFNYLKSSTGSTRKEIILNSPTLAGVREINQMRSNTLRHQVRIRGGPPCPKCPPLKKDEETSTKSETANLRSLDEGANIIHTCQKCTYKWIV